ncbi:hypothetical protein O6H91_22G064900 [Diphasiastrum complanatum]|uniref:Uncharacterized protein n=1 Tax=Diphasiastrum complanatum TaxID=34168 RepID=A0ACC2AI41_DIPCM|nr:hypothetical protein O6H91_22G064900 [Diphasiastrum complanatum]
MCVSGGMRRHAPGPMAPPGPPGSASDPWLVRQDSLAPMAPPARLAGAGTRVPLPTLYALKLHGWACPRVDTPQARSLKPHMGTCIHPSNASHGHPAVALAPQRALGLGRFP